MFEFRIQKKCTDTFARTGTLRTPHGTIHTPCFMPVGTRATVKGLTPAQLHELKPEVVLANTYHLYLRPGHQLVKRAGGLHRWMNWDGPILTDSGGFQVFSLSKLRTVRDDGIEFASPLDGGKKHFLTPKQVMHIQAALGADIIMAFDECAPGTADKAYARSALERTHRWVLECKKHQRNPHSQALFPIAQGVVYPDLRIESVKFMADLDLPGIAIGGLSVGESKTDMYRILDAIAPHMPVRKPHYLMGVGSPEDLVHGVLRGIDMFDCVLPTRLGRTGAAFLPTGRVNVRNSAFRTSMQALDPTCTCYACTKFSRSYLHHLIREQEILGMTLLTMHNVHFLLRLMDTMREQIAAHTFLPWSRTFLRRFKPMKND